MLGTLVNAAAILAGSFLGLLIRQGFSERFRTIAVQAQALCVILIGLQMALKAENILIVIMSMVFGSLLGEWIDIEKRLDQMGSRLQHWAKANDSGFVEAFVTTTLIYCVGSMAIVGSIEAGVRGDYSILYAKSTLDGIFSIAMAASMGIGVAFSAIPVFLYQGAITLGASSISHMLTPEIMSSLSATGGLLIFAIGLNMLEVAKIRLGNQLPAIFIAAILARFF